MSQRRTRSVPVALAVVIAIAGAVGCGGGGAVTGKKAASADVVLVPKNTDNPYFEAIYQGAKDAQRDTGGKVKQVGTNAPDVAGQTSIVTSLGQQRQPVIAVSGLDPDALAPSLRRAQSLGSKVISYDADVQPDARKLYINAAPATALGVVQLRSMAKMLHYRGEFAILSAQVTAANQNAWIAAMKRELSKPAYARMKLVKVAYGNDEPNASYDQAVGLLRAFPSLKGILAPTPVALDSTAKAIKDQRRSGSVKVAGLGFPPGDKQLLKNGQVSEYVLWSPRDLGYLTFRAATALAKGEITGKAGETFDAGKLGTRKIGAKGEIVLGPPQVFTAKNVDQHLDEFATGSTEGN